MSRFDPSALLRLVARYTAMPYTLGMYTVIETSLFARYVSDYWSDDERLAFVTFIAQQPEAGDVVPGSGGVRKLRWAAKGKGKRGGVRVIYYNRLANDEIWLLTIYGKGVTDNLSPAVLRQLKETIGHD